MILSRLLCGLIFIATMLPLGLVVLFAALASSGFHQNEGVAWAIGIVGVLLWLPIFFYVWLGLLLADQAVALEGLQPVDSIRRSWSLVRGHRWMLLWYSIVTGLFAAVGLCACCIGIFLTGSMTEVAKSESFLALTRGGERGGWWIQTGSAPEGGDSGWGAPASLPSQPVGWGAPPPPPA